MKKLLYVLTIFAVISCSSGGTKIDYKKTIADYVQTDKNGTKHDLKIKLIELEEYGTITVEDSITHLTKEFRKEKEHFIKRLELAKKMEETLLAKEKIQSNIDKYKDDIARTEYSIDSLKNLIPDNLNKYQNKNSSDILSIIVRCKYSITLPNGLTAEEKFDFYLSPDGRKCYAKKKSRVIN